MADASTWGHDTTALEVCQAYSSQIKDKVILVTGPTVTGVGYGTAEAVARLSPKLLILAGRSQTK
jgi:FlaA1/EpsC-like NDP-sugar epimerase